MKGFLPKRIASAILQCAKCVHFKDDDPDIYYCDLDRPEFAGLCEQYQPSQSYLSSLQQKGNQGE